MSVLPPTRRTRLPAGILLILLCIGVGFIVSFLGASPANASLNSLFASPTPTQEKLWAFMDLGKPTITPAPLIAAVETPLPAATETPAITMEIVQDGGAPAQMVSGVDVPSIPAYSGSKYILVDISDQHMYVYEGDVLVYSFVASTGINNATRAGTFAVQSKIPNAYGSTWDIWMPNWLGIYWSHGLENGIHALPILPNGAILWEGYLGRPVSYGCVVLGTYESKLLYDWAEIGTPVEIQW